MMGNSFFNAGRMLGGLLALFAAVGDADAQPLDDVSLEFQDSGVVATIRLTGPVRYLSHFPASHGDQLEIFYERIKGPVSDEKWIDNEVRKSPPSGLIPSFTVVTRGQQTDKPRLVINFSREAEYSVAMGNDNRSVLITIQPKKRPVSSGPLPLLPAVKPETAAAAGLTAEQAQAAENNRQARALMIQGRDALAAKNNDAAVDAFNKLLLLPPNDYTQDGQEWVGVARERAGQLDKAKIEYDLYLRLYPEGEGAARVARRMDILSGKGADDNPDNIIVEEKKKKKSTARWLSFGGITSHYYYGHSTIDSTFTFNNATTSSSQSLTDQSMLISTVNASERYLSDEFDGRLVFSDVNTLSFLENQASQNRLNAAYGEIKGRTSDFLVRVGRQSPMGGGVQGRFDGLAGGYGDAQSLRVNAVAGRVVDYYSQSSKAKFYGASVDSGLFSVYGITQTVDGTQDRRALGAEFRYFKEKQTVYALLDYDIYFKTVNTVQVMGSTSMPGYNLHYMIDHRRPLSIRNALNGANTSSISELLQAMSPDSLRRLALARTGISNMGQVGASMPLRKNWQAAGDLRLSNTTGLSASDPALPAIAGSTAAVPGRGLEKGITAQIIGSNLYKEGDTWSASAGFNSGSATSGRNLYFYNHTPFNNNLMVDASLQLSSDTDQNGGTTKRTSPMLRGSYRVRDELYADADGGFEITEYNGSQQTNKITRYFFSLGVRWDF